MNQKTKTQETDFYKHYLKVKELILNTGSIPRDLRGAIRTTLKNLNCYSYEKGVYTINEISEIDFNIKLAEYKNKKPIYVFDNENKLVYASYCGVLVAKKFNKQLIQVRRMVKNLPTFKKDYYFSYDCDFKIPEFNYLRESFRKTKKQIDLTDKIIEGLKSGGKLSVLNKEQICKEVNISVNTLSRWINRNEKLKEAYLNRDYKIKDLQHVNAKYKNLNENAFNELRNGLYSNLTTQQIADKFKIDIKLFYVAMNYNQELKELVNNRGFKQPKASRGLIHLSKEEKERVMTERKVKRIVKAREEKRNTPKQMSVEELIQKQREREKQGLKIIRKTKMSTEDLKNKIKNYR